MKTKTLNDYIQLYPFSTPFYKEDIYSKNMVSEFLTDKDFQSGLTGTIYDLYADFPIRKRYTRINSDYPWELDILTDEVVKSVMTVYVRNKYKYDKLYETLDLSYNPLDNVDEHDEWTETHSGKDVETENLGSKTSNENLGNRSDSTTIGQSTNVNTHDEAPFNTDSYHNKTKDTLQNGSHTDSASIGAQSNQYIEGAQENKDTFEHGHTIHYERHRHGNIGVTSAFQLINQARETALFSLYEIIAKDIKDQLCLGVLS